MGASRPSGSRSAILEFARRLIAYDRITVYVFQPVKVLVAAYKHSDRGAIGLEFLKYMRAGIYSQRSAVNDKRQDGNADGLSDDRCKGPI